MLNNDNNSSIEDRLKEPIKIDNQFIPIIVCYIPYETYVALALLKEHDIHCFLPDESILSVHPWYGNAIGGVKIWVDRHDFDLAKEILVVSNFAREKDVDILRQKHNFNYKLNEVYVNFRIKKIKREVGNYPLHIYNYMIGHAIFDFIRALFRPQKKYLKSYHLVCPHCSSENVFKPRISRELMALTYLLTSVPIPIKSRKVFCFDCRETFKLI